MKKKYDLLGYMVALLLLAGQCPICLEKEGRIVHVEEPVIHLYEHELEK